MNKHLPASNVRELQTAKPVSEQFLMIAGKREPWVFGDLMDRASVVEEVGENYDSLAQIIALSLEAGTCRDATDEIVSIVIDRWAQDDVELSRKQRDFVAMCKGEAFANAFRVEDAA